MSSAQDFLRITKSGIFFLGMWRSIYVVSMPVYFTCGFRFNCYAGLQDEVTKYRLVSLLTMSDSQGAFRSQIDDRGARSGLYLRESTNEPWLDLSGHCHCRGCPGSSSDQYEILRGPHRRRRACGRQEGSLTT